MLSPCLDFYRGLEPHRLQAFPPCLSLFLLQFFRWLQVKTSFLYFLEKTISLQPALKVFECLFYIISTNIYLQVTSFLFPAPCFLHLHQSRHRQRLFWLRNCFCSLWAPAVLPRLQRAFFP